MSKIVAEVKKAAEITIEDLISADNTSKKIRLLNSMGFKNGEIEKIFQRVGVTTKEGAPIRYQHIRNVLITPINQK